MENILHNLPEEVTVLQMFQPIYLLIGALYLLIATGTRRLNCSPIRKEIHHHEKLFEALIGAADITMPFTGAPYGHVSMRFWFKAELPR